MFGGRLLGEHQDRCVVFTHLAAVFLIFATLFGVTGLGFDILNHRFVLALCDGYAANLENDVI
ncbi:MAG TPA: hypothetical protein VH437_23160 [Terriglobales bacterium]